MNKLTTKLMRQWLIRALSLLAHYKSVLDKINVFPVADGDTGSNMTATLAVVVDYVNELPEGSSAEDFLKAVQEGAVNGALGNSGIILASWLIAFCEFLIENIDKEIGDAIGGALTFAAIQARSKVAEPRDGTILTAMHDIAYAYTLYVETKSYDTKEIICLLVDTTYISVDNTPEQMPKLKERGVVDSGAYGMALIVEAASKTLRDDTSLDSVYTRFDNYRPPIDVEKHSHTVIGKYRYCTQATFRPKRGEVNESQLRAELCKYGDSFEMIHVRDVYKIHIHTDKPKKIEKIIGGRYQLLKFKFDDMIEQSEKRIDKLSTVELGEGDVAIITDATADLTPAEMLNHGIDVVPMQVTLAGRSFRHQPGWPEMSPDEFYSLLAKKGAVTPKTAQVTQQQWIAFAEKYLKVGADVLLMPFSKNISGTYTQALVACKTLRKRYPDRQIACVDTNTSSRGLAYLCFVAREALNGGMPLDKVVEKLDEEKLKIHIYVVVDNIDHLLWGGRLKPTQRFLLNLLHKKPLIEFDKHGKLTARGTVGAKDIVSALVSKAKSKDVSEPGVGIRPVATLYTTGQKIGQELAKRIDSSGAVIYPSTTPAVQLSPIVGAHLGPGKMTTAFVVIGKTR